MSEEEIINNLKELWVDVLLVNDLDKFLCNNNKYRKSIEKILDLYNKEKEKNNNILGLIFQYGQIDGEHHKTWVIDQIVRILTGNDYDKWVQHYEYDEATGEDYTWDKGIAP